jgi:hypothetical protein
MGGTRLAPIDDINIAREPPFGAVSGCSVPFGLRPTDLGALCGRASMAATQIADLATQTRCLSERQRGSVTGCPPSAASDSARELSAFVSNPTGSTDESVQASLPGALRRDRPPGRTPGAGACRIGSRRRRYCGRGAPCALWRFPRRSPTRSGGTWNASPNRTQTDSSSPGRKAARCAAPTSTSRSGARHATR